MKYLTIDQIKQQLRLDDQQVFDEHDLLELYGDSAEDTVLNILNRTMEDVIEQYGRIPAALRHATLMLVDNAYKERSPITPQNMSTVPYAFDLLIKPYMHLV
jgi:uncharacterized phage protein (predicted DNA packaging)